MNSVLEEQALAQFISGEFALMHLSVQSGGSKRGSLLMDTLPNRPLIRQVVFRRGVLFFFFSDPTPALRRLRRGLQGVRPPAMRLMTLWQIDGEKLEAVTDFIFLGFRLPADGDCSHESKRCVFLGRKAMTYLDSMVKSSDITLLNKSPYSQNYGFSSSHVWM